MQTHEWAKSCVVERHVYTAHQFCEEESKLGRRGVLARRDALFDTFRPPAGST